MKHFTLNLRWLIMSLVLCVGGGTAWGETSTLTFTEACGGSGTADDGTTLWTVTSDGSESSFDNTKGIHYGTSSAKVQYIKLSTSDITGTITKVVVNASTASGVSATASVTVGGTAFGGGAQSLSTSAKDYTFEDSKKGEIIVTVSKPSSEKKALYVKSIAVTYTAGELTDPSFEWSSYEVTYTSGQSFTAPTLSYASGYNGTVLYKSSDENVATVSTDGVITPIKAGTTNISAYASATSTYAAVPEGTISYQLTVVAPAAPTFSPASGSTYENSQEVSINGAGTIYYTTDGSTPTTSSTQYTAPFTITDNITVKAIAVDANGVQSEVSEASYTNTNIEQPINVSAILNNVFLGVEAGVNIKSNVTNEINGITIAVPYDGAGNTKARGDSDRIRFYTDNKFIATAPAGYNITKIVFTEPTSDKKWNGTVNVSGGNWDNDSKTWTGSNISSVTLTFTAQCQASNVTITLEKAKPDCVTDLAFTPTELNINDEGNFTTSATEDEEAGTITYSYSCSNAGLTVSSEGAYTANAGGTYEVTLTATPANTTHKAVSVTQTVTVVDPDAHGTRENPYTVAEAIALIETLGGSSSDNVYVKGIVSQIDRFNDYDNTIQYWISDDGKTTVQLEVYRGKNLDNTTFSSVDDLLLGDVVTVYGQLTKFNETPEFDRGNYIVSLEHSTKADPELSYSPDSYTISLGETFTAPTLTNPHNLPVTYSSDKDYVAAVDAATGAITLGTAAGTVTITATFAGDDEYVPGQASYTLTVANNAVQYFKKVTSMSDLVAGKEYILVATGMSKAISEENSNGSNRKSVSVDIVNDKITIRDEAVTVFTLGGASDAWTFQANDNKKYLAVTTNGNYLEESDAVGTENKQEWTVTADYFNVVNKAFINRTIGAAGNNNNSFATYTNNSDGKEYAVLFVKMPDAFDVKITAAKMGTLYVGDGNLVVPEGVTAQTLKLDESGDGTALVASREYKAGDVLPAGEAVIIYGEAGDYSFEYTTDAAKFEAVDTDNLLKGSDTATTDNEEGYSYYTLGVINNVAGFYRQTGTEAKSVQSAAHKAYLKVPNASGGEVKSFYVLGGDTTTGVTAIETSDRSNNAVYNLAGQRVVAPTKGLYIVNGKKVFIK